LSERDDLQKQLSEAAERLESLEARASSNSRALDDAEHIVSQTKNRLRWAELITSMGVGAVASVAFAVSSASYWFAKKEDPRSISDQAESLATVLSDASDQIALIEAQVQSREAAVASLEERAKNAEAISALRNDELEAVNALLRDQIEEANRRSFWSNSGVTFLTSFVFYIAGLISPTVARKLGLFAREVS